MPPFGASGSRTSATKSRPGAAHLHARVLSYYAKPGPLTDVKDARLFATLPDDISELVRIVQGLVIHEHGAEFYGVQIPERRKAESHLRAVDRMMDRLLQIDKAPLASERPAKKRLVGVCDHFARLLVTFLRSRGKAARARFGFGAYFNPPRFEEHIVVEYWDTAQSCWK